MNAVMWEADKLGRQEESQFLTNYLVSKFTQASGDESLVMNLNAERGMGKSYFLDNWARDLILKRHPVINFNAWENDFSGEPLMGLLAELENTLSHHFSGAPKAKRLLDEAINKAKRLLKPSEPILTSLLSSTFHGLSKEELSKLVTLENKLQYGESDDKDSGTYSDMLSTVAPAATEQALKSFKSTKESINAFRSCLQILTNHINNEMKSLKLPIFIFIDELDQCRPDYTIDLLEKLKRLFAVRGIYIVVATNSSQLMSSVRSIYGSDTDTSRALKQFFDLQYSLAKPQKYQYAEYLFHKHKLDQEDKFFTPLSIKFSVTRNLNIDLFAIAAKYFNLSLSEQEQVCVILKAICLTWTLEKKVHLFYILFLLMLQQRSPELYQKYAKATSASERISLFKQEAYRKLIDDNVVVKTSLPAKDGFHSPHEKEKFEKVALRYSEYLSKSIPQIASAGGSEYEIYNAIREQVIGNMPEQFNPDSPPRHELGRYIDIVQKASNLIQRF